MVFILGSGSISTFFLPYYRINNDTSGKRFTNLFIILYAVEDSKGFRMCHRNEHEGHSAMVGWGRKLTLAGTHLIGQNPFVNVTNTWFWTSEVAYDCKTGFQSYSCHRYRRNARTVNGSFPNTFCRFGRKNFACIMCRMLVDTYRKYDNL